jgi:hypothetical protein
VTSTLSPAVRAGTAVGAQSELTFEFTQRLRYDLQAPLADFLKTDHASLPTPRLRAALRQFESWERRIDEASKAAGTALPFLEAENLQLRVLWIPERMVSRRNALSAWVDSGERTSLLA